MHSVDPSFVKIWHLWANWWNSVPYWDPYGAAITLILGGFACGYLVYLFIHET